MNHCVELTSLLLAALTRETMIHIDAVITRLAGPREPNTPSVLTALVEELIIEDEELVAVEPHKPVTALLIRVLQVAKVVLPVDWKEESLRMLLQELVPGMQSAGSIRIARPEYAPSPLTDMNQPYDRAFCPDPTTYTAMRENDDTVAVYDFDHPFTISDDRLVDAVCGLCL
jgi:hypothetical protein